MLKHIINGFKSILKGIKYLFTYDYDLNKDYIKSDYEALKNDWQNVNNDLYKTFGFYRIREKDKEPLTATQEEINEIAKKQKEYSDYVNKIRFFK